MSTLTSAPTSVQSPAADPAAAIEPNKLQALGAPRGVVKTFPQVRRVTMVCKNHLDIGFTESAAKVVHDQINWMMPTAVAQAARLREEGMPFCWTVGSWLVWEALERRSGEARAVLERGIADGALAWLANPFTTHTELMDAELFEAGLALSRRLDERFGKKTIAAKMTDVPGHTRGVIPLLARAGVRFFHIGVNHMSPMPEVPPLFRWRDPDTGVDIVVAYHTDYGGDIRPDGHPDALLFRMVGDNMEVPSPADVRAWYADARAAHPNAESLRFGRIDDFAATLEPLLPGLPVLDRELGDSWIHGVGSDPVKVARFRELLRRRKEWLRAGRLLPESKTYVDFSNKLALVAEHTWSVSLGAHLPDRVNYANADFARVRHRGPYRTCEASWQEQRDYLENAVEILRADTATEGPALAAEAERAFAEQTPCPPRLTEWTSLPAGAAESGPLRLDPRTGAVTSWLGAGGELAAPEGLGLFRYQSFSADHMEKFRHDYCGPEKAWAGVDFGKPGLRQEHAEARWWPAQVVGQWIRDEGRRRLVQLTPPAEAHVRYGAPREVWVEIAAGADERSLEWTLSWFDKTATRLPEAFWMSYAPRVADPRGWRLRKLDRWIDPAEVVSRGGRALHAVECARWTAPAPAGGSASAAAATEAGGALVLETPDAPLIAPGKPALATFTNEVPDLAGGLHVNLFNNIWGTNFPAWNGEDQRFRFRLSWEG